MSNKNEVITETERGTLTQLDGTETDQQGNPLSKKEVAQKAEVAEENAEAVAEQVETTKKAAALAVAVQPVKAQPTKRRR